MKPSVNPILDKNSNDKEQNISSLIIIVLLTIIFCLLIITGVNGLICFLRRSKLNENDSNSFDGVSIKSLSSPSRVDTTNNDENTNVLKYKLNGNELENYIKKNGENEFYNKNIITKGNDINEEYQINALKKVSYFIDKNGQSEDVNKTDNGMNNNVVEYKINTDSGPKILAEQRCNDNDSDCRQ